MAFFHAAQSQGVKQGAKQDTEYPCENGVGEHIPAVVGQGKEPRPAVGKGIRHRVAGARIIAFRPDDNARNEGAEKAATLKKRKAHEDFKRKYFDYYDDVKTSIKQDW